MFLNLKLLDKLFENDNKKWKQFDASKFPKDWKVFVITKDFFTELYGPTLINLAQYYEGPEKDDENEK